MRDYAAITDDELDRLLSSDDPGDHERALAIEMADLAEDPLEWVRYSYPWGVGDLDGFDGPDEWQTGFLNEWGQEIRIRGFDGRTPVSPIRMTTTSGHGVGKSALTAWAVGFIMSTRPMSKGIVTANTSPQLETKTWAEIAKWSKRMITAHWFRITTGRGAMKMVRKTDPENWRVDGMAWRENMPEAFAGLHAATGTPFYIFDEASGIARSIFETAEGGLTDGEPMQFLFSNPTQGEGFFYDTHHDMSHRYKCFRVDSRKAAMTNKKQIEEWIEDYGIDSNFVKVRVLGEFPSASGRQFIPSDIVMAARSSDRVPFYTATDPVIIGVDVARYGGDESTIYIRRGRDGRTHAPKILREIDNVQLAHEIRKINDELMADAINIDAGQGQGVIDTLRNWGVANVNEVHFGGTSPDEEYDNMATYMMAEARDWLKNPHSTIPDDGVLSNQLTARRYWMVESRKGTAIKIESKEEIFRNNEKNAPHSAHKSPDRADGFCLTFAVPVRMRNVEKTRAEMSGERPTNVVGVDYDR
jgi:hypothetical protein